MSNVNNEASKLFESLRETIVSLENSPDSYSKINSCILRIENIIEDVFGYPGDNYISERYLKELEDCKFPLLTMYSLIQFEQTKQHVINLLDRILDKLRLADSRSADFDETFSNLASSKQQSSLEGKVSSANVPRVDNGIYVYPLWKGRDFTIEKDLCFLLMPFTEAWSNDVWTILESIVTNAGMRCERADEKDGRIIMEDIWSGICRASIVIADLTAKNPNVTYEVGLADVLGKNVILLSQTPNDVPFDFKGSRLIVYENTLGGEKKLTKALEERLKKLTQTPK